MAASSTAVMAAPHHETDMAAIAKNARGATVFWIDSIPGPPCDPAFTDSLRFTRCHAIRAVATLPSQKWSQRLATRLGSDTTSWHGSPCGFSARAVVRFPDESAPSRLVVFA